MERKLINIIWFLFRRDTRRKLIDYLNKFELKKWEIEGKPTPPPHIVKQMVIKEYQLKHRVSQFVETGTFFGDMVLAQMDYFEKITSIELSIDLAKKAALKFRKYKQVTILQGDSSQVLIGLLRQLKAPVLFWLDGHYSGGFTAKGNTICPIIHELDAIFAAPKFNHIILIDDARLFVGKDDYPTITELENHIKDKRRPYKMHIENDVICIELHQE